MLLLLILILTAIWRLCVQPLLQSVSDSPNRACSTLSSNTSTQDYETDAIIQNSLRKEGAKDVSVITIAHRLHTVMDSDKIVSARAHSMYVFLTIEAIDGSGRRTHCGSLAHSLISNGH